MAGDSRELGFSVILQQSRMQLAGLVGVRAHALHSKCTCIPKTHGKRAVAWKCEG